jgi:hypothetical protein
VNVFLWGQLSMASICLPIVRLNFATSHAPLFVLYIMADSARSDVFTLLHFTILAVHPSLHIPVSRRIMSKIALVETAMKREIILRSTPSWAYSLTSGSLPSKPFFPSLKTRG